MMDAVVSGVKAAADPDGYIMAFPRWAMDRDEDPDYVVRHSPLPSIATASGLANLAGDNRHRG